jgi:DNA polymerase-3 subunit beta
MKISSLQENLKLGLNAVNHIAGKNINLPILNNVLIEAKDGNIKLITTDLEIGIITTIRGKVDENGSFTVDAKVMTDFISLLPNKKIDLSKKENKLIIKSENYNTVIRGQEADEFPLIPKVDRKQNYRVVIDEFKKALAQVIFSVSTSETRIELSGVLFNFSKDRLTLVATDSYRLAEKTIKINPNGAQKEDRKIIIPAKTLQELVRILSALRPEDLATDKNELEICVSENQVLFSVGGVELISRLIEGQYPDYKQIIPSSSETTAIINRVEFLRAVKAAAIFSKSGINDINLDFPSAKNKIVISSASSQTGENIAELDASVRGKDNGMVINYRYILDGLNNILSDNIKIEIINNNTPCVVKSGKEDDYVYIIMPIKQ